MMDDGQNDGGMREFQERDAEQQQGEEMLNIYQRMAAVMQEVEYIQKERKEGMKYTIVSHDAVTAKIRPALIKHGIIALPSVKSHSQDGNRTEVTLTVRFINVEKPVDFVEIDTFGYGIDPQDKGPGKAVSYAFKYALLKGFCLETGDDPDKESIDHQPRPFFDSNATFGYIAKATTEKALKNLYRQSLEQGATPEQMAKVADACAARKALLQKDAQ